MSVVNEFGQLADDLVHFSRLCYDRHLVGAAGGNLSLRLPGCNAFFVTAGGVSLRDVARENIVVVDGGGKLLPGSPATKPSKETGFHLAVYEARPEVCAVIHVHPPYATVFSARKQLIPTVTISAQLKLKQGPVIPMAPPGSKELSDLVGRGAKAAPPEATVLLMEAHGLITMRPTLRDAFDDAELAEDTAKIALLGSLAAPHALHSFNGLHLVDLTAPLNEKIQCYPTDPPFAKRWHVNFSEQGVCVSKLEMGAHAGTHVDAPSHFLGDQAPDLARMPMDRFFGEAIALETPKKPGENVTIADTQGADVRYGDIVLFRTGWEKRASSPAFFEGDWPGFDPKLIEELNRRGVKAVGGDIASADSPTAIAAGAPAHKVAGRAGMPIFEALVNMHRVTGQRFLFIGFPLNLEGGEASPIRAIALLGINNQSKPTK
jgi:kynurenine formamidase/ribulose-5-phosphate 4-epimerase/fuculose-1-phosphate aldolase